MFYIFLLLLLLIFLLSFVFFYFARNIFVLFSFKQVVSIIIFEIFFVFFVYVFLGNFSYVFTYYNKTSIIDREEKLLARDIIDNFSKQVLLVKQNLEFNPNNYNLWWHLGKLYEMQGMHENSVECLKNAYFICDNNLDLMINYSLVMAKKANGNLDADNLEVIKKILLLNPKQIEILNLIAIDAYKNKNFSLAKKNWNIILNEIKINEENYRFIEILKKKIRELNLN